MIDSITRVSEETSKTWQDVWFSGYIFLITLLIASTIGHLMATFPPDLDYTTKELVFIARCIFVVASIFCSFGSGLTIYANEPESRSGCSIGGRAWVSTTLGILPMTISLFTIY